MTEAEVERALPLLTHPSHVRFEKTGHFVFHPEKEPVLRATVEFLESL